MKQLALLACSATLLVAGCRHTPKRPTMPPMPVVTITAQTDSVPSRMEFVGVVASNFDAVIQPRVSGYLKAQHYAEGMPVRRGQLLFTIEPDLLSTTMLAAEAALESARAQALEAHNNYQRAVPLARINAISQSQLDQYTAQNSAAKANVHSAEQSLRNARLEVGYTQLRSPINGIAAYASAHEGDFVGPGTQFGVLTTISNTDTVSVDLSLPMSQYMRLGGKRSSIYDNAGLLSDIRLTLADGELYPIEGQYYYTRKDLTANSGTIVFVVQFPNPNQLLKQGQFARVAANVGPTLPRVVVPQQCVNQAQGVNSVWIMRPDSTAEFRRVTLGPTFGQLWCVDSGIAAGEQIVAEGGQKLHTGMKVAVVKR